MYTLIVFVLNKSKKLYLEEKKQKQTLSQRIIYIIGTVLGHRRGYKITPFVLLLFQVVWIQYRSLANVYSLFCVCLFDWKSPLTDRKQYKAHKAIPAREPGQRKGQNTNITKHYFNLQHTSSKTVRPSNQ